MFPVRAEQDGRREGHLPRRHRKVRRGGHFIPGGGEGSRGQRSRKGDGSQQGPSDLQAPPRLVKYLGPVHSPSLTPEHPVMQRCFQL